MRDLIKPIVRSKDIPIPTMRVGRTGALIYDQGITYNESGISYNEVGYAYGGLYGCDFAPMVNRARNIIPHILLARDFAGTVAVHGTRILYAGMPMGPGFFLYITYPTEGTVTF